MPTGFMYLVAVMDWFSRFVLAWELSNSMETDFCLVALEDAFAFGQPFIFNSDQGSQFTSRAFTSRLSDRRILISMDGRRRCYDNIFIERLWRSVKYEETYSNAVVGSILFELVLSKSGEPTCEKNDNQCGRC